jgi:hypothetical protein
MNTKFFIFVFIFALAMSGGHAIGGSRYSFGGLQTSIGDFNGTLSPPLTRLNNKVDAGITRVKYRSRLGYPGYSGYRGHHRSRGHSLHFKSPGLYYRHGYNRYFYKNKPYSYYYKYRPYRPYYKYRYFGYHLPLGEHYLGFYGLESCGYNLGPQW